MLNSALPPNKILDIYSNVNRINREKDESNKKMIKLDEKKLNIDKQTSDKQTNEKMDIKDESETKYSEWHAINSVVNSLPIEARKDAIEFLEDLLKHEHIVLNKNFTISNLKTDLHIDINEFLRGIFMMKSNIRNNHQFFNEIMEYIPHKIIRNVKLLSYKENTDLNMSIGGKNPVKKFKWILF